MTPTATLTRAEDRLADRVLTDDLIATARDLLRWVRRGLCEPTQPLMLQLGPHQGRPAGAPRPAGPVFVTLYRPGAQRIRVGLAGVEALLRSPDTGLEALRAAGMSPTAVAAGRLKVDLVVGSQPLRDRLRAVPLLPPVLRRQGVTAGSIRRVAEQIGSVLLPEDYCESATSIISLQDPAAIAPSVVPLALDGWPRIAKFMTRSFVERADRLDVFESVGGRRLFAPLAPGAAKAVLARCKAAGRWVLRGQGESGGFSYLYDPVSDRSLGGYNVVRHAGTTMALAQLAVRTGDRNFLGAALAAVDFMRVNSHAPKEQPDAKCVVLSGEAPLGATALGLLALLALPKEQWNDALRNEALAFARFILYMQRRDGNFECVYTPDPATRPSEQKSIYYPGEATLALTRLYAREHDLVHLEAALRGADAILGTPFWKKGPEELLYQNSWLMQALPALHAFSGRERYRTACLALAKQMVNGQWRESKGDPPQLDGAMRPFRHLPVGLPAACSAASRLEGLVEATALAQSTGGPTQLLRDACFAAARFILEQQIDADTAYFVRSPRNADGCFRESFQSNVSRMDFAQHALTSLLGVERMLREAAPTSQVK